MQKDFLEELLEIFLRDVPEEFKPMFLELWSNSEVLVLDEDTGMFVPAEKPEKCS